MQIVQNTVVHNRVLGPREGYDQAAYWYDNWHWAEFWKRNEVSQVGNLLDNLVAGQALDAGTGTGLYRFQLASRGYNTVGIDVSNNMLKVQRGKEKSVGCRIPGELYTGDIRNMPKDWSAAFDLIICARVFSHIENYKSAIRQFNRVLRRGGSLILTDIAPSHPYTNVRITNGSICREVEAFKHDLKEMGEAFENSGLRIQYFKEHRLCDLLWHPPISRFEKIYRNPDLPIFYVSFLTKQDD